MSVRAFGNLRERGVPEIVLPALGGLATGLIALVDPEVLYQGWGNVNGVLDAAVGEFSPLGLAQIVALKVLATSLCRGSGLVGGLYAPSIFVGRALLSGSLQCDMSLGGLRYGPLSEQSPSLHAFESGFRAVCC